MGDRGLSQVPPYARGAGLKPLPNLPTTVRLAVRALRR